MKRSRAILLLILAGALWSLGGLLIKSIPWPPLAISGLRGGIAAVVIYLFSRGNKLTLSKSKIIAACCYALVVTLFVMANKLTTAGNAILLQYTAPVYVALFGYMFLGERTKIVDWVTIVVLLFGLGLFFIDDLSLDGFTGNIFAILSGMSFAALTLLLRKQLQKKEYILEKFVAPVSCPGFLHSFHFSFHLFFTQLTLPQIHFL